MKQILNKLHIYAFFAFIVIAFLALPNQTFAMAGVGGKIYERINGVEVPLVVTVDAKITPPVGGISNLSTTSSPIFTNLSVETGNGTLQVYGNYAFGKIDCAVVGNSRYEIRHGNNTFIKRQFLKKLIGLNPALIATHLKFAQMSR